MDKNNTCNCCNGMYHGGRKFWKVVIVIVLAIFVAKAFGWHQYDKNADQNVIAVSGKGEISVTPDMAEVSFAVTSENMDVAQASNAVNTKMAAVLAELKADGVADADVKTTGYDIEPRYNYVNSANAQMYPYPGGTQVLAGYDVTENIDLKIRDLKSVGKVMTDLATLKVTNVSGLSFTESNYDDLVKQARDAAITDARSQAQALAKSLGVSLDKIVSYNEGGNYPVPMYAAMSAGSMAKADAVLPTGQNKITSNVTVTYEIR